MQGQSHQGRQAALEKAVVSRGALAEWLQQAGAEGQLMGSKEGTTPDTYLLS